MSKVYHLKIDHMFHLVFSTKYHILQPIEFATILVMSATKRGGGASHMFEHCGRTTTKTHGLTVGSAFPKTSFGID